MNHKDEWGVRVALLVLHASIMLITLLAAFCLLSCNAQFTVMRVDGFTDRSLELEIDQGQYEESKTALHIESLPALLEKRLDNHA